LATAHSVVTKAGGGIASLGDQVGTGSITFDFGTWEADDSFTANASKPSKTVTITDGSIAGIRDAINEADIGVSANIIFDGTDYRLTMTSDTGAASAMRITTTDDDGNHTDTSGLSTLAFDKSATTNLDESVTAQDAEVSINGLLIKSASNTLTDAVENVTIDLKKAEVGTVGTLTVAQDTAGIKASVESLVESFNSMMSTMKELSYFNQETGERGVFLGDSALRNIESNIRRVMGQAFGSVGNSYNSLASIGLNTQRDGSLALDSTKFDAALANDLDQVRTMFAGGFDEPSNSNNITYSKLPSGTQSGSLAVNITQAATQGMYTAAAFAGSYTPGGVAADEFVLKVNGANTAALSIPAGPAITTGADLAAAVQTALNADANGVGQNVTVAFNAGTNKLEFTSKEYGSNSSIYVDSAGANIANAGIGTAVGTSTLGMDVQGTIGGSSTRGSYASTVSSFDMSGGGDFVLKVDGQDTGTINITAADYSKNMEGLVADIQTQLDADSVGKDVTVSYNSSTNKLEFLTNSVGAGSSITVTSSNGGASANLGIGSGTATAGTGLTDTTFVAGGSGQTLSGSGDYSGVEILYSGTSSSYIRATNEHKGLMKELSSMLDGFLLSDGIINAKSDSYKDQIADISDQRERLGLRLESMELSLIKKFGAMDGLVAQMNSTSTYLAGQFQSLANLNKK
jgi:flagellar hook-associated protein 2